MSDIHFLSVERTMTRLRSALVCAIALASFGCHPDAVTTTPVVPLAGIHFVNAVPDTMQQAIRVVDIVSNASLFAADFRAFNAYYQGIEAGSREIKVFLSSTDPSIAQQFLADTTYNFAPDQHYTFVHTGFSRTGQTPARAVWIIQDNPPTPGLGQVGLRLIHAGAGIGPVDIYMLRHAADTLALPAALATNVAYGTVGATYTLAGADTLAPDSIRFAFYNTGTITGPVAIVKAPAGILGTSTVNPIAGSRVAGTVLTAILVPRSVLGSMAPQTAAFTVPTVLYLVDKRPPNTAP
jgi:uncharacterized protein DUF4397